tara:strand:- start:1908 stop:2156 length:249 start_codon:yes stop_codon:yes gene_type:complete
MIIDLTYTILNISDIGNIIFSEIIENNSGTLRQSNDRKQFGIKYESEPSFITNGSVSPIKIMDKTEAIELMQSAKWSGNLEK